MHLIIKWKRLEDWWKWRRAVMGKVMKNEKL